MMKNNNGSSDNGQTELKLIYSQLAKIINEEYRTYMSGNINLRKKRNQQQDVPREKSQEKKEIQVKNKQSIKNSLSAIIGQAMNDEGYLQPIKPAQKKQNSSINDSDKSVPQYQKINQRLIKPKSILKKNYPQTKFSPSKKRVKTLNQQNKQQKYSNIFDKIEDLNFDNKLQVFQTRNKVNNTPLSNHQLQTKKITKQTHIKNKKSKTEQQQQNFSIRQQSKLQSKTIPIHSFNYKQQNPEDKITRLPKISYQKNRNQLLHQPVKMISHTKPLTYKGVTQKLRSNQIGHQNYIKGQPVPDHELQNVKLSSHAMSRLLQNSKNIHTKFDYLKRH